MPDLATLLDDEYVPVAARPTVWRAGSQAAPSHSTIAAYTSRGNVGHGGGTRCREQREISISCRELRPLHTAS